MKWKPHQSKRRLNEFSMPNFSQRSLFKLWVQQIFSEKTQVFIVIFFIETNICIYMYFNSYISSIFFLVIFFLQDWTIFSFQWKHITNLKISTSDNNHIKFFFSRTSLIKKFPSVSKFSSPNVYNSFKIFYLNNIYVLCFLQYVFLFIFTISMCTVIGQL